MNDLRNDKTFFYSQMTLQTFKKCPLKFKLKYLEGIRWKNSSPLIKNFAQIFEKGQKFHLLAERYFRGIQINFESLKLGYPELYGWLIHLKNFFKIDKNKIYLPEYQLRLNDNDLRLQAKYDLLICDEDKIEIWDWKTNVKKLKKEHLENDLQTMVYLYLVKRLSNIIVDRDIPAENIKMYYWQPNFSDNPIVIDYNSEKHLAYEKNILSLIDTIKNYDFEKDFKKINYKKHCGYCEFNYFCNEEKVNFLGIDIEELDLEYLL